MKQITCLLIIMLLSLSVTAQKQHNYQPEKIIGADISFLPQLEQEWHKKCYENGIEKDAISILKEHGFNYIRLRIFNNPAADSGYSPKTGFCDLQHTLQMAKRIKAANMKLLIDFHYSDYWADPQKQFKPLAWKDLNFIELKKAVTDFTQKTIQALKDQGTLPDMVQIGNEINHGMIWPDGKFEHIDSLADLFKAGVAGVKAVDNNIKIMLHIACGGQNKESRDVIDKLLERNVQFDIIGESYYPQWHGTIDDLNKNITDLSVRYKQDIIVVEYSEHKKEVNDIALSVANKKIVGSFIWEPLNTWEAIFDKNGNTTDLLKIYDSVKAKYAVH